MSETQPMERLELLRRLLSLEGAPENILEKLQVFCWNFEEIITLTSAHIHNALIKYTSDEIDETVLHYWAESIECREDIAFDDDNREIIAQIIFELSTPELGFNVDKERTTKWINQLSQTNRENAHD